jgi:hypothetical protein
MIAGHVPAVAFLLATRAASWLRLSRREEAWKTAEILILRHQLTVLQRHQPCRPKLTGADRALLVILLSVIPKARRWAFRLGYARTPGGPVEPRSRRRGGWTVRRR